MNAPVRFNRLTLLVRDHGRTGDGHIKSLWRCDCGAEKVAAFSRVKAGTTRSCGCLVQERSIEAHTTHGMRSSPEYSSWMAMRRRCENVSDKDYPRYGGRGVTVCAEWSADFACFFAHVGLRPAGTSLDRIDGRLGYQPGNVRWATPTEQGRNRRNSHVWHIKGAVFQSIGEAAAAFGVSEQTVFRWAHGFFDKRRCRSTPAHPDCRAVRRYA